MIGRRIGSETVARIAELLAEIARERGVSINVVYSVVGRDGERFYTTSFDEAAETARRVAAGERAA